MFCLVSVIVEWSLTNFTVISVIKYYESECTHRWHVLACILYTDAKLEYYIGDHSISILVI